MSSMFTFTVPVFISHLNTLKYLLSKGAASTTDKTGLLATRLCPDMGDLIFQIQRISDTSKGFAVRVGGVAPVGMADNEKTFEDLEARLQKTIDILKGVKEDMVNGKESIEVIMKTGAGELKLTGIGYTTGFAIPNFYFHYTTAYNILRHSGIEVGKQDFLGANTPK